MSIPGCLFEIQDKALERDTYSRSVGVGGGGGRWGGGLILEEGRRNTSLQTLP